MLKNKETYEIMDAELVGLYQDTSLVLGKHSGRHAFRSRLQVTPLLLSHFCNLVAAAILKSLTHVFRIDVERLVCTFKR